jgi:hypothetical protein
MYLTQVHSSARPIVAITLGLASLFALGCSAADANSPADPATVQLPTDAESAVADAESPSNEPAALLSGDCSKLTRTACMDSKECTLVLDPNAEKPRSGKYLCRPALGSCEQNLSQAELTRGSTPAEAEHSKQLCSDRPGCSFKRAECYCACNGYGATAVNDGAEAPPCLCVCGGGTPSACEPTS